MMGQSYFRTLDPKEENRNQPYPPLGSIIAATYLEKLGYSIEFYDAMIERDPNNIFKYIDENNPDILILYDDEFNYLTKMSLLKMRSHTLKVLQHATINQIYTIVYSSDAIDHPEIYLKGGAGLVIIGEGETVLEDLLIGGLNPSINQFDFLKSISGVVFIDEEGNLIKNERKPLRSNLDELPDPNYEKFVDLNLYKQIWIKNHGYFSINISTSRGCTYGCNWCAKPLWGRTYNSYSPRRIANLILNLSINHEVDHIWITDDIFGLEKDWLEKFAEECKKLDLHVPYKCLSRADLLIRGDTIENLRITGCEIIWIGAESGSQKVLDAMEKGTKVEQIVEASERVKNAGMKIAFFLQLGYLGEDWNDVLETRGLVNNSLPDDIGISVSYPLPGTKFYNLVESHLTEKRNWLDSSDLDLMFHGTYTREFYRQLHALIHHEYRYIKTKNEFSLSKTPKLVYHLIYKTLYNFRVTNLKNKEDKSKNSDTFVTLNTTSQ